MKLSSLPVSFFPQIIGGEMTVGQWAQIGRAAGLDAIDISILFVKQRDAAYLRGLRQEIEDSGLGLKMVTTYPDFTHPAAAERRRQLEQLVVDVQAAAQLGAQYVRVTAGQGHPTITFEDGLEWAVAGLTGALQATRASGVTLVFENHARPGVWQYPDFSFATRNFLAIVERTAAAGLKINFDTANTLAFGDEPVPLLQQVVQRVETVHAADTSTRGALNHTLLGTGLAPFGALFGVLKGAGWDGWICMEEGSHRGPEGVAQAARFVRETWTKA